MSVTQLPGAIAMSVAHLCELLRRAAAGEDPDLLLMEEFANAEHGSIREWAARQERHPGEPGRKADEA